MRVDDSWTIVFWRSLFAAAFLLAFMLVRDGPKGTLALLGGMGSAGLGIALCFAVASPIFIVALAHTTVANILLMQAGGPLWVWLAHGEVPGNRTLLGGSLVILALVAHLAFEWRRQELS